MAYPLAPDFTSGAPESAWWVYARPDGSTNICSTTGAAFIARLRTQLGLDATPVWDAILLNALISQASAVPSVLSALQQDLANNTVSAISVGFGIYLAYYSVSGLQLSSIGIPSNAVLPQFGVQVQPSQDPSWDALICYNPQSDAPPLSLTGATKTAAQQQSVSGIRLAPGQSLPVNLSAALGAVVGLPLVLLIGAVFIGGVWWLSEQNKEKSIRATRRASRRSRRGPL